MASQETDVRQRAVTAERCPSCNKNLTQDDGVINKNGSNISEWSFDNDVEKDATYVRIREAAQRVRSDFVEQLDDRLGQLLDGFMDEFDKVSDKESQTNAKAKRRHPLQGKVFVPRESLLTQLLVNKNIQTIYNIFVAILIVFMLNNIVSKIIETGSFEFDFKLIRWCFGKFPVVMWTWCMMMLWTMAIVFPTFQYWARHRHHLQRKVPDVIWLLFYTAGQVIFLLYPVHVIVINNLPPASAMVVTAEQVRLMMKTHSFVRENVSRALKWKPPKDNKAKSTNHSIDDIPSQTTQADGNKDKTAQDRPCPDFSQFLYFLFAPTLIYRDSYPMTPKVRWDVVRTNLAQVLGCLFYTYYIFESFCVPVFRNFGKEELTLQNIALCVFGCMLPGTLMLILGFFAILHSWLNAHAEMLRFADRQFYKDWWNSKSFSNYYRTWNVVVHDWLYTYVYQDCQKSGIGRGASMVIVFFISAVVHEYIIIMAMQFFYPVLFVMFGGLGLCFLFLTDKGASRSWNVFMWVSLFIGNGLLMCLYSQEWFARKNCTIEATSFWDYITPLSWYCNAMTEC